MNLKHIKVAEVYSYIQAFLIILAPLTSSFVQCTVWKPRGCIEHSADVCSGSVMPFDVIAVNMTPFAFVELQFAT